MQNYSHINKSSRSRMGIIFLLLCLWLIVVFVVVICVTPLSELVKTAPLNSTPETAKQLNRLAVQRDYAAALTRLSKILAKSYQESAKSIKKSIKTYSYDDVAVLFQSIKEGVESKSINKPVVVFDFRGNRGGSILKFETEEISLRTKDTGLKIDSISLGVWKPTVKLGEDRPDSSKIEPVDLASIVIDPKEKKKYFPVIFGNEFGYNFNTELVSLFTKEYAEIPTDLRDKNSKNNTNNRLGIINSFSEWLEKQASSNQKDEILDNINISIRQIHKSLDNHLTELDSQIEIYEKEKKDYEEQLQILQNRLKSSNSLFFMAASRVVLVTIVVVSIGFVLIRAFAAELTQMRRMSYLEISADIAAKYDPEKLPHIPEIVRAVGGDKSGQSVVSDGAPPDAITVAESLGNAVSKFSKAAKP